ncbi:MAG: class I SAM-dependent methyltransferase [Candidatus Methylomirabilia bacterium]
MDPVLEQRQVKRVYALYSPVYDVIFDWIFNPGRRVAVQALNIQRADRILEVGIGTGLNLPLYPRHCQLVGIDISDRMLEKAQHRIEEFGFGNVSLRVMDAGVMNFADNEFDRALATYVVSAVPDPVGVLREMRRVVKPGGTLVILNHFRSDRRLTGAFEDFVAPLCTRLGWKSNLALEPLLREVDLVPETTSTVNLFHGWRLIVCVNRK